jgi:hypothetical protein
VNVSVRSSFRVRHVNAYPPHLHSEFRHSLDQHEVADWLVERGVKMKDHARVASHGHPFCHSNDYIQKQGAAGLLEGLPLS